jgi:hypothetical protein
LSGSANHWARRFRFTPAAYRNTSRQPEATVHVGAGARLAGVVNILGPGRVTDQPSIKTEIASHPRGCFNALIRSSAADYGSPDAGGAKPCFQISSNEGAVHSLHDDRFSFSLPGLVPYEITCPIGSE